MCPMFSAEIWAATSSLGISSELRTIGSRAEGTEAVGEVLFLTRSQDDGHTQQGTVTQDRLDWCPSAPLTTMEQDEEAVSPAQPINKAQEIE